MSKQVALAAEPRPGNGKGEARALRRTGRIPAVAYGSDLEPWPLSVDALELFHALHTDAGTNAIIRLKVHGDDHLALAREIHRHPVRRDILHVDFVTVDKDKKVVVDVPVILEGHAPGTDEGGVLDQQQYTLPIEVLPLEVPDHLVVDVSQMDVGDVKRVEDLDLPSGVTILEEPERTVVTLHIPQLEVPEPAEGEEDELAEGEEAPEAGEGEEPEGAEPAAEGDEG